ncbi:MAG: hypothetical protein ACREIA_17065 [Opitutaceae bacterium]
MGLTIQYGLRAPAALSPSAIEKLLRSWAWRIRKGRLGRPGPVGPVDPASSRFQVYVQRPVNCTEFSYAEVSPRVGFFCRVEIGEGCEPLIVGLCRYPGRVNLARHGPVFLRGGWRLSGFCKTVYAGVCGEEHFVDCHRRVIDILTVVAPPGAAMNDRGAAASERSRSHERNRAGRADDFLLSTHAGNICSNAM